MADGIKEPSCRSHSFNGQFKLRISSRGRELLAERKQRVLLRRERQK